MAGSDLQMFIPPGTKVSTQVPIEVDSKEIPVGAIGVVTATPIIAQGVYHVRFDDGRELPLLKAQIKPKSAAATGDMGTALVATPIFADYGAYIQYRCIVGAHAYGLAVEQSSIKRRGWYLPPADAHWSLDGVPAKLTDEQSFDSYWELGTFIKLALKASPNVLECLYTPYVEYTAPLAEELLSIRDIFISKLVYRAYKEYVQAQFNKLNEKLKKSGRVHWEHAMQLVRLLIAGTAVLESGEVRVNVAQYRERLLSIKNGQMPWKEVNQWQVELQHRLDTAYELSFLPPSPDYARANRFLINARRSMVE